MDDGQRIVARLVKLLNEADAAEVAIWGSEESPGDEFTVSWWTGDLRHVTYQLERDGDGWNGVPINEVLKDGDDG